MLSVLKRLGRISDPQYLSDSAFGNFIAHDFVFQIEPNRWSYTENIDDAQLVPFIMNDSTNAKHAKIKLNDRQMAVNLLTYDIDYIYSEGFLLDILDKCSSFSKNTIVVHQNENLKDHPDKRLVYHDAMFNIVKLYTTEYDRIIKPHERVWSIHSNKEMYRLPTIQKNKTKKFLSMAYVHELWHPRNRYRHALGEILKEFSEYGYIGEPGNRILPNSCIPEILNRVNDSGGNWYPAGDRYYQNTYLSIFVETVTQSYNSVRCITEKTYDHIGRGNFILPFAYPGIIKDLKKRGFRFPSWINYNYDEEIDNDQRFLIYINEAKRLVSKSINELHEYYIKDKEILIHNQNCFRDLPYCSLYDKIKERYDSMIVNK